MNNRNRRAEDRPQIQIRLAKTLAVLALAVWCLVLLPQRACAQGSLTPPGAPAPTMKSLDQIASTGIALNSTNTPGDSSNEFIINAAGNYYLTGNLTTAKTTGIHVTSAGVTVDLNGFQLSCIGPGNFSTAVLIEGTANRCTVKNGNFTGFNAAAVAAVNGATGTTLLNLQCNAGGFVTGDSSTVERCSAVGTGSQQGFTIGNNCVLKNCVANHFYTGISAGNACTLSNCTVQAMDGTGGSGIITGDGCTLINCSATNNTCRYGITTAAGSSLTNCVADSNILAGNFGASAGITVGAGSVLNNCAARNNTAFYGIYCGDGGCSLTDCAAVSNTSAANSSYGIYASNGSNIIGCIARGNTNTRGGSYDYSTGVGIAIGSASTIKDCTASSNKGDGILVASYCIVLNNTASDNTTAGGFGSAGIHVAGSYNRIEANHTIANHNDGILVDKNSTFGKNNIIIGNSSGGNSDYQYRIPGINGPPDNGDGTCCTGDNAIGQLVGGNTAVSATSVSPLANIYN